MSSHPTQNPQPTLLSLHVKFRKEMGIPRTLGAEFVPDSAREHLAAELTGETWEGRGPYRTEGMHSEGVGISLAKSSTLPRRCAWTAREERRQLTLMSENCGLPTSPAFLFLNSPAHTLSLSNARFQNSFLIIAWDDKSLSENQFLSFPP